MSLTSVAKLQAAALLYTHRHTTLLRYRRSGLATRAFGTSARRTCNEYE